MHVFLHGVSSPALSLEQEVATEEQQASIDLDELLATADDTEAEEFDFSEMLDDEPEDDFYDEPEDDELAEESFDSEETEDWNLDERFIETSIMKLNIAMMKSGAQVTEIDAKLRDCSGRTDKETIQQCLTKLKTDCETYLAEQSEAAERFSERIGELGELSSLGDEIEMLNLEQAAQIETTISNLTHMDFDSDLEAANIRLLEEINNLRTARHTLRDSQEVAYLTIARYENRLDQVSGRLCNDPLTQIRNRIGLETTLDQWWTEGRHRSRQMSAAVFDIDGFGPFNEQYGSKIAEQLLQKLVQLIQKHCGEADLLARYAGQRFFLMFVDQGPRAAMKRAELMRQSVERATFKNGEEEIQVTVHSAFTEVTPEDTTEKLFQRLEETLRQAKQAGPNQAFQHDGRDIEKIESPSFGAEYVDIPLA